MIRPSVKEAYAEFLAGVTEDDRADPEDFAETAFYAGWDSGWEDAEYYYGTGGSFK